MNQNPLNILHTIGLKELYPIIRCQLKVTGAFDVARFRRAVTLTAQVVPELFCKYNLADNSWTPVVNDATTVVRVVDQLTPGLDSNPDWFTQPQLRVFVEPGETTTLVLTISHILTDGSGFKQYLYLLSDCYNRGEAAIQGVQNTVALDWLHDLLKTHPAPKNAQNVDHPAHALGLPRLAAATAKRQPQVSGVRLSSALTRRLVQATHAQQVTVNDVLMATFGKTVQAYDPTVNEIAIACPTDMRQSIVHDQAQLRIANHTARYNPAIAAPLDEPIRQSVQKMHAGMAALKAQDQFLDSVRSLMQQYQHESIDQLQQIVEANYHVRPIGYTNFGIVDDQRLTFDEARVDSVILTGSFRFAPMYQIACSTFRGQLSLGFNMVGTAQEVQFGRDLAKAMVGRIEAFIDPKVDVEEVRA